MIFLVYSINIETDLNDGGKVLSTKVVLCLQIQVTQLTGSYGVVLGIELIEALEGLSSLQRNKKETRGLTEGIEKCGTK